MKLCTQWWMGLCVLAVGLAGCSHVPTEEVRQRDAVQRLGVDAAGIVLNLMQPFQATETMVLVARAHVTTIDATLPNDVRVSGQRLQDALVRGILQHPSAPQVVGWAPHARNAELAHSLWRLDSAFVPSSPIALSDRKLYPYQLTLQVQDANGTTKTVDMSGAFDSRALGPMGRRDTRFTTE